MIVIVIFVVILIIGAIILSVIGIRGREDVDPLAERMAIFADAGEVESLDEIEMSQSFIDRIFYPLARKMGDFAVKFTPQNALAHTAMQLEMAGNPRGLEPTMFFAIRFMGGALGGGFLFFIFLIAPTMSPFSLRNLGITFFFALLGFFIPNLLLTSKIGRRQHEIQKSLPDALDLLTICVEAGLGFDAAMSKVQEKWENELSVAFGRVLQEIQLGKLRREALKDMSDRIGLAEMHSFVGAIIQSEQLGVSMAKILRIQSDDMRVKRKQRAEQKATEAPIKMLFPMAILIFPTIMLLLMGPAVLLMMRSALGDIFFGG